MVERVIPGGPLAGAPPNGMAAPAGRPAGLEAPAPVERAPQPTQPPAAGSIERPTVAPELTPRSGGRLPPELLPGSPLLEACLTLRANLSPGAIDTPLPPLLVLGTTSDAACAGVAAGLAVALAEEGRSTLLVDADLRLPTLHTLFSVPRAPGLADLVESLDEQISGPRIPALVSGPRGRGTPPATPRGRGRASEGPGGARRPDGADDLRLAERLPDVTPITEHLSILPAGAARRHAAEVLRLPALGTVVQQLAHRFDVVVFHTSGRPDFPDALLLAAHVRSAVLLIRAGVDSAEHIRRVKEPLERAGVTLLGFALVGQRV